jgi:hypothetical protein
MQAREAARVLERMSDSDIQVVFNQLADRLAAGILSNLSPERAAQLTQVVLRAEEEPTVMQFVQSLAGRASGAVERLAGSRESRHVPQNAAGRTRDFASALAVAINSPARDARESRSGPPARAVEEGERADDAAERSDAAAAAAAAAVMAMGAPIDPTRVHRSLELLDPVFRARLQRVIERMQAEFGLSVGVTETFRTRERQDFLFGQGRSRPGQVVTWTRASNHLLGRAADVMIGGTHDNRRGYARLAQLAAQEGLNTLGAKDPGHIELRGGERTSPEALASRVRRAEGEYARWEPSLQLSSRVPAGGMARVAVVARVAIPGLAYAAAPASSPAAQALNEAMRSIPGLSSWRSEPGSESSGADEEGAGGHDHGGAGTREAEVARVLELQDGARGPLNHVVLRVDNPAGGQDRIRVDLRGARVDATLNMSNPADAERISARIGDLQKALESRGLEAEALRVRSTAAQGAEGQNGPRAAPRR